MLRPRVGSCSWSLAAARALRAPRLDRCAALCLSCAMMKMSSFVDADGLLGSPPASAMILVSSAFFMALSLTPFVCEISQAASRIFVARRKIEKLLLSPRLARR